LIETKAAPPSAAVPAPRVSILIPTYNQERFMGRAVVSALAQDYADLEVVVVDDASTDETAQAAHIWSGDPRFRFVRNPRNLGRVANYRHALAEQGRGDWVLMLDGDDYLGDPSFISQACAALARHADRPIVFAQAGHRVRYLDGKQADVDILPTIGLPELPLAAGDYLRFVFETGFFTHLGALYNRREALRVGFYTAEISASDMDSLFRLALEGEVLLLNILAGCWVQHGGNASSHVPLRDLAANVRIPRRTATEAVARGLATWEMLGGPLQRYEVDTLLSLFGMTIRKSARGPLDLWRLLRIARQINPQLLKEPRFLRGCLGFLPSLTRVAVERSPVARLFRRPERPAA
jgi:glycosyltransferase involved in cell wall biosynthesis